MPRPPASSTPAPPRRRFWLILFLIAGCVSAVVSISMQRAQRDALQSAAELVRESDKPHKDEVLQVGQTLRAMKLITVEVRATVESAQSNESWRGDVHASVRAPVTYFYGVDLSRLEPGSLHRDPLTGTYTIHIPRPVRLATEVLGGDEVASVDVTGTRFRDLSGEYLLGLARTGLYEKARTATLGPIDRRNLDDTTRTQIAGLIRVLAGGDARVNVEFASTEPPAPVAATPEQPR